MWLGWAERTTKSCCSLTLGCSSSSRSLQPGWLGLSPSRSRAQSSFRSKSQPKSSSWEPPVLVKHRMCSWSHSCLQPGLWAAVPTEGGDNEDRNCPNSQQPLKNQCSSEPVPLLSRIFRKHYERPKRGWNFYFRMKDLEKACTTKRHLPEFPLLWEMGSGFLLWATCPYLPELTRAPNAAPWKATEISLGSLGFYF